MEGLSHIILFLFTRESKSFGLNLVKGRSHISYEASKNEDIVISPTLQQSYLLHQNGACGTSPSPKMVHTAYLLHQNGEYSISPTHKME